MTALTTLIRDIQELTPTDTPYRVREVQARARRLHRADLLPAWCTPAPATPAAPLLPPATPGDAAAFLAAHDPAPVINAKAAQSNIPAPLLREVYCRELTSSTPLPPHLTRVAAAHARVNTFIRLAQGDISARDDDADLLALLNY